MVERPKSDSQQCHDNRKDGADNAPFPQQVQCPLPTTGSERVDGGLNFLLYPIFVFVSKGHDSAAMLSESWCGSYRGHEDEAGSGWIKSSLPLFSGGNVRFFGFGGFTFFLGGFVGIRDLPPLRRILSRFPGVKFLHAESGRSCGFKE